MEQRQKEAPGKQEYGVSLDKSANFLASNRLEAEFQKVVHWLRNKAGLKAKTGILNGKRVDYFKGA